MIPVLAIVGASGSGKTTLIERVLPELGARGVRVGVVKHAHKGFDIDRPGKDSDRVRVAGAAQVLVASHRRWALLAEENAGEEEPSLYRLMERFTVGAVDLVLAEGFSHERCPKVEVYRPAHREPPRCWPGDPDVLAVASDALLPVVAPVVLLDLNAPAEIAAYIRQVTTLSPTVLRS